MLKRQRYLFSRIGVIGELALLILLLWGVLLYLSGMYDFPKIMVLRNAYIAILKTVALGIAIIIIILFLLHEQTISRTLILGFGILNFIFLSVERALLNYLLKRSSSLGKGDVSQVLVIGTGEERVEWKEVYLL